MKFYIIRIELCYFLLGLLYIGEIGCNVIAIILQTFGVKIFLKQLLPKVNSRISSQYLVFLKI
jgi:hypothetical protein